MICDLIRISKEKNFPRSIYISTIAYSSRICNVQNLECMHKRMYSHVFADSKIVEISFYSKFERDFYMDDHSVEKFLASTFTQRILRHDYNPQSPF